MHDIGKYDMLKLGFLICGNFKYLWKKLDKKQTYKKLPLVVVESRSIKHKNLTPAEEFGTLAESFHTVLALWKPGFWVY